jgi:hypothetical protein
MLPTRQCSPDLCPVALGVRVRLAGRTKAPPAPLGCRADKLQIELATLRTAEDLVAWATWCCPPKTHCKPRTLRPSRKISKPNAARSKRWSRPRIADRKRATAGHVLGSGLSDRGSSGGSLSKDPPQAGQGALAARPLKAVPRLRPHTCDAHHLRFAEPRALGREAVRSSPFHSVALITGKCTSEATRGPSRNGMERDKGVSRKRVEEIRQSGKGRLTSVLATA